MCKNVSASIDVFKGNEETRKALRRCNGGAVGYISRDKNKGNKHVSLKISCNCGSPVTKMRSIASIFTFLTSFFFSFPWLHIAGHSSTNAFSNTTNRREEFKFSKRPTFTALYKNLIRG